MNKSFSLSLEPRVIQFKAFAKVKEKHLKLNPQKTPQKQTKNCGVALKFCNPPIPTTILNGRCGFRNCIDFSAFCTFYLVKAFSPNSCFKRRKRTFLSFLPF